MPEDNMTWGPKFAWGPGGLSVSKTNKMVAPTCRNTSYVMLWNLLAYLLLCHVIYITEKQLWNCYQYASFCFMRIYLNLLSVKSRNIGLGLKALTHWGWGKTVDIWQIIFSNASCGIKILIFNFGSSLFPRIWLTTCQQWFWSWLGT